MLFSLRAPVDYERDIAVIINTIDITIVTLTITLTVTLMDADGNEWDVLLSPPGRSRRAGFTGAEVEVGDTVTAFGHRRSEGNNFEMKTERIQVGSNLYNLYPNRS